jgi:hypothetical protein
MPYEKLETLEDVMTALGGRQAVADLLDAKSSTISMWKYAGKFPANTYVIMTDALHAIDKTAPATLWAMKKTEAAQ